jgi:hypothetical protein
MSLKRLVAPAILLLLSATGAAAQVPAGDDWDLGVDPARKLTVAAVSFDRFGVAVRCMDGSLSVVMSGLPEASGQRRLLYSMGGAPEVESLWVSGARSTSAFALWPRSFARTLSRGGRLSVAALEGETTRRYVVDLPPSPTAIATVFQACGHELDPPADDQAPASEDFAGLVWARAPEISYPSRARYDRGLAAIQCTVAATGRLQDCTVESEFPEDSGFGRQATLGAHRSARVEATDGSTDNIAGRRVSFVTRYRMEGLGLTPAPSRLPPPDAIYNPSPGR